jgi:hypothetical protein
MPDKYTCVCGAVIYKKNLKAHEKTDKHKLYDFNVVLKEVEPSKELDSFKDEKVSKEPEEQKSELIEDTKTEEEENPEVYINKFVSKLEEYENNKEKLDDRFIDILNDYKSMSELQNTINKKLRELSF